MATPLRVLIVEDVEQDAQLLLRELKRGGFDVTFEQVDTPEAMIAALAKQRWDIVISDYSMPHFSAPRAIEVLKEQALDLPLIIVSGTIGEDVAVEAIRAGASDFMIKGKLVRLIPAIQRELRAVKSRREHEQVEHELSATARRLQGSEMQFVTFFEHAPDAIVIANRDGRITQVNKQLERLFGWSRTHLVGQQVETLLPQERREAHAVLRENYMRDAVPRSMGAGRGDLRGRRKDGTEFPVEISLSPMDTGTEVLIAASVRDITERRRSEERLIEQAALLDQTHDAIMVHDLKDRIRYWNKGAERMYGWTAAEAQGQEAGALLYAADAPSLREATQRLLEVGEWSGELRQKDRAGRDMIVDSRWSLLRDAAGGPRAKLVINSDITEQRKIATQVLRNQRLESIGTLAGGVAHDLNNVLAPIIMGVELLLLESPDQSGREVLETVATSARRGADIVSQILAFARGVEGARGPVDLRRLIAELQKLCVNTFPRSIRIHTEFPTEQIWSVLGNATELHQVIMNLSVNARDAMPDGGRLTIAAENIELDEYYARMHVDTRPGRHVVIRVVDTGVGMLPHVVERIFEPFFTTKPVGKGTGLGLSSVLGIVKSYGGFVNVYSEIGKGTEFKVYLPAQTEAGSLIVQELQSAASTLRGSGELILVVDDEQAIRAITQQTLEANGYRVLTAADGSEGVALFAEHRGSISVVVTDLSMPYMDGAPAIRAIQHLQADVPIIAISGLAQNGIAATLEETGVRFLHKPFSAAKLLQLLHEVITGKSRKGDPQP